MGVKEWGVYHEDFIKNRHNRGGVVYGIKKIYCNYTCKTFVWEVSLVTMMFIS